MEEGTENPEGIRVHINRDAVSLMKLSKENALEAVEKLGLSDLFDYNGIEYNHKRYKRLVNILSILEKKGISMDRKDLVYMDGRGIHIWKEAKNFKEANEVVKANILRS